MTTTQTFAELAESLGFSLEITSGPRAIMKDDWQCIQFGYELLKLRKLSNGQTQPAHVHSGEFHFGTGHVKIPRANNRFAIGPNLSDAEYSILYTLQSKPHAKFTDPKAPLSLYQKLATHQKLTPTLADVLSALLSDGAAHFDHQSFPDWCSDFGYSDDSIKAKEMYATCYDTGASLARVLTSTELDTLREAASNL